VALDLAVEPVPLDELGDLLALALPRLDRTELARALDPDLALEVVAMAGRGDDQMPARIGPVEHAERGVLAPVEVLRISVDVPHHRVIARGEGAGDGQRGHDSECTNGSHERSPFPFVVLPPKTTRWDAPPRRLFNQTRPLASTAQPKRDVMSRQAKA